jgi:hypothetical protein
VARSLGKPLGTLLHHYRWQDLDHWAEIWIYDINGTHRCSGRFFGFLGIQQMSIPGVLDVLEELGFDRQRQGRYCQRRL